MYEYCERLNELTRSVATFDLYLQPTIEIYVDGSLFGARLVDDGMGECTYYVEFYDPEDNIDSDKPAWTLNPDDVPDIVELRKIIEFHGEKTEVWT